MKKTMAAEVAGEEETPWYGLIRRESGPAMTPRLEFMDRMRAITSMGLVIRKGRRWPLFVHDNLMQRAAALFYAQPAPPRDIELSAAVCAMVAVKFEENSGRLVRRMLKIISEMWTMDDVLEAECAILKHGVPPTATEFAQAVCPKLDVRRGKAATSRKRMTRLVIKGTKPSEAAIQCVRASHLDLLINDTAYSKYGK